MNRTFILIGSGPSLTQADVDLVESQAVTAIAINDGYLMAPWAPILYAADQKWWHFHAADVAETFEGIGWTQDRTASLMYGLMYTQSREAPGLSRDLGIINQGKLSGYQAINLAYHLGANVILLLGYDMKGTHWFGSHQAGLNNASETDLEEWRKQFATIVPEDYGLKIFNCTRDTALDCFPLMDLEDALESYG